MQEVTLSNGATITIQDARAFVRGYKPRIHITSLPDRTGFKALMFFDDSRIYGYGQDEQSAIGACYLSATRLKLDPSFKKETSSGSDATLAGVCETFNEALKDSPAHHANASNIPLGVACLNGVDAIYQYAREFVEFYLGKPPVIHIARGPKGVKALMYLGEERIYVGGEDEQSAIRACYLDAAKRLELFAPEEREAYGATKLALEQTFQREASQHATPGPLQGILNLADGSSL